MQEAYFALTLPNCPHLNMIFGVSDPKLTTYLTLSPSRIPEPDLTARILVLVIRFAK